MQDRRPIAYECKKLNDCQRRWPTYKIAMVHCLKMWKYYLNGLLCKCVILKLNAIELFIFHTIVNNAKIISNSIELGVQQCSPIYFKYPYTMYQHVLIYLLK